jgi:hypothetical protein
MSTLSALFTLYLLELIFLFLVGASFYGYLRRFNKSVRHPLLYLVGLFVGVNAVMVIWGVINQAQPWGLFFPLTSMLIVANAALVVVVNTTLLRRYWIEESSSILKLFLTALIAYVTLVFVLYVASILLGLLGLPGVALSMYDWIKVLTSPLWTFSAY